jgi:hypothetical protein
VARRERGKLHAPTGEEAVGSDEECVSPVAHEGCEGRLDFAAGTGLQHHGLQSESARRFRYVSQRGLGGRSIRRIDQYGDTNGLGHQLMQEPQPLGHNFTGEKIDAGRVAARPRQAGDETELTGSSPTWKTIGIVAVAALAASAAKAARSCPVRVDTVEKRFC